MALDSVRGTLRKTYERVSSLAVNSLSILLIPYHSYSDRQRRNYVAAHGHAALLVAPAPQNWPRYIIVPGYAEAWVPAWEHLTFPGNRLFYLKTAAGREVVSGNLAAACSGFAVEGEARLVGVFPAGEWKAFLRILKCAATRGEEQDWVQRCVKKARRVLKRADKPTEKQKEGNGKGKGEGEDVSGKEQGEEEEEDEGGEAFEVWSVHVRTKSELIGILGWSGDVASSQQPGFRWISRTWIPPTAHRQGTHPGAAGRRVWDLFVGDWSEGFIEGNEEGVQFTGSELVRAVEPRRSVDSGILE